VSEVRQEPGSPAGVVVVLVLILVAVSITAFQVIKANRTDRESACVYATYSLDGKPLKQIQLDDRAKRLVEIYDCAVPQ
jgi:hypothetical protein